MYKEAWGLKRICPMCSKQYYDLGKTELECPECGKEIEVTTMSRPRRGRKPGSMNAAPLTNPIPPKPKEKEDEEPEYENEDDETNSIYITDAINLNVVQNQIASINANKGCERKEICWKKYE